MDTSNEYIKMCDEAKEIQKLDPGYGDEGNYYFEIGDDKVRIWSGYSQTDHPMLPENRIWLPRQDQLQDMLNRNWNDILNDFYKAIFSSDHEYFKLPVKADSMEQLWLTFVMKEKYSKEWNGEEWK